MKQTTAPTTTPAKTHGSQPFFGRPAQASLSAEQTEPAFFGPAPFIQAKLTIGAPDDPYEREADAVAEQVVQRMSAADNDPAGTADDRMRKDKMIQEKPLAIQRMPMSVQRKCAACEEEEKVQKKEEEKPEELQGGIQRKPIFESNGDEESSPGVQPPGPMIQRKCAACEKEEQEAVQRKPAGGGEMTASPDVSSRLSASKGGGSPLPATVQNSMGGALGADLSGVRVHTDSQSVQLNRDLGAQAFTHGSDVYFGAGKFQPGTGDGDRLLAHELVHVGQQGAVIRRSVQQHFTTVKSKIPTIQESVEELISILLELESPSNEDAEDVFKAILLHNNERPALKSAFLQETDIELEKAIEDALEGHDRIKALRYLEYGTLRLADKLYFATKGIGQDTETLYRLLPLAHKERQKVEVDFMKDYGDFIGENGLLPSGRASRIAGLLEDQLSGWELDKAKALFDFGALRPVDEARIALEQEEPELLYPALQRGMSEPPMTDSVSPEVKAEAEKYGSSPKAQRLPLEAAYFNAYESTLSEELYDELSGDDYLKAQIIIGTETPIKRIHEATDWFGTDPDKLFDAIKMATPEEKSDLLRQFHDPESEFYQALQGEIWQSEMDRIEAMLTVGQTNGDLLASAEQYLTAAGATDSDEILEVIKFSCGKEYEAYKMAWDNDPTFLADIREGGFFTTSSNHFVFVFSEFDEVKIRYGLLYDENYLFHVLECFVTTDEQRRMISGNTVLMKEIGDGLSTSEFNRVLDLLALKEGAPQEMFDQAEARMEREKSELGEGTRSFAAMQDERREWQYALERAKADGEITPEEGQEMEQMQTNTQQSIGVYIKVRDELENMVAEAVSMTVSIVAGFASGGLTTWVEFAIIGVATGFAKLATNEIIRGERFDALGADGLPVFAGGFAEGLLGKFTAGAGKNAGGLLEEGLERTGQEAAENLGESGIKKFFKDAAVNGATNAASTAVETAVTEDTWDHGFLEAMNDIMAKSAKAGGTGTVMSMAIQGGKVIYRVIKNSGLPDPSSDPSTTPQILDNPGAGMITLGMGADQPHLYFINGRRFDEAGLLDFLRNNKEELAKIPDLQISSLNPSKEIKEALDEFHAYLIEQKNLELTEGKLPEENIGPESKTDNVVKPAGEPLGEATDGINSTPSQSSVVPPESADNWAQVSTLIGRPADEVIKEGSLPPGYIAYKNKKGKTIIRRLNGDDANFARLTVDDKGLIQAGKAASRRISKPGAVRTILGERPPKHQGHHVMPDEVSRDHPLMKAARENGKPPYEIDTKSNLVYLAEAEEFKIEGVSDGLPLHKGSHPDYSLLVSLEADTEMSYLIDEFGSLGKVPPEVLSESALEVEERAWHILEGWVKKYGAKLK